MTELFSKFAGASLTRFNMCGVYENRGRVDQLVAKTFFQNPLEDLLKQISSLKTAAVIFAEGGEVGH